MADTFPIPVSPNHLIDSHLWSQVGCSRGGGSERIYKGIEKMGFISSSAQSFSGAVTGEQFLLLFVEIQSNLPTTNKPKNITTK